MLLGHLYYYKNQGCTFCMYVCMYVCVCVMFMQATFPFMDQLHILHNQVLTLEGGQWLFKLQSYKNKNKINQQNRAKTYRSTYPIKYDVTCVLCVRVCMQVRTFVVQLLLFATVNNSNFSAVK